MDFYSYFNQIHLNLLTKCKKVAFCAIFLISFVTFIFVTQLEALIETYECKIDTKNRVLVPVALKKQLESILSKGFIIKRAVHQPCLELYPIDYWNKLMIKLNQLNPFLKKNQDFIRLFKAGEKMVEIDSFGRMLIPKELMIFAKLSKDLVLSTSITKIEIWDKTLYESVIGASIEDFSALAEDVMGNIDFNDF